jgi:long-chain fatty acid transport protein
LAERFPQNAVKIHIVPPLLLALCAPLAAFALGIRITDHDARATARGGAFAATADNPSAIYYNPAGISQLNGTRSLLGAYAITLESTFDPAGPGAADLDSDFEYQAAPYSFATMSVRNTPLTIGFGTYAPFGFGLEYPDDASFRTLAKKGKIQFLAINPVLAWKINDSLSVAAGVMVNYVRTKLARGIINPGDEFIFEGDGIGYGFNAGILWSPHRMHSFGLTYRSRSEVDLNGHSRVRIPGFSVATPFGPFAVPRVENEEDSDLEFRFPQTITAGYSFRPTPDWNFEFDIDWTDWDNLNTLTLHRTSGDVALPFNWESSFMYSFGATRKLPRGFSVSAGYIYSENSVPNESFNPLVPDSNRHVFSVGFGQQMEKLSWDFAYQYAYGPHRRIDNGTLADGVYRFQSHAVTFSLGYRF